MIDDDKLRGFPASIKPPAEDPPAAKRVVVSGCFDWFHSGHVRFFEEASEFGRLHVVVGNDANLRLLKGEGHPLFPQEERRYMVQAVKYVDRAWISSGKGWLDAEPEIAAIQPHYYVVNEDGDVPEKRTFCEIARHRICRFKAGAPRGIAQTSKHGFARVLIGKGMAVYYAVIMAGEAGPGCGH